MTAPVIPHSRPVIDAADRAAVDACLRDGMLEHGAASARLEAAFHALYDARYCAAVGSGSLALLLALDVLEVGPGDEVVLPTYLCPDVMAVVEYTGARAVLADVDEDYLLDPEAVRTVVSERTRAIVFSYQFGIHRDVAPLRALGVPIIEDCAHFLAPGGGRPDIDGSLAFFSFKATKLICAGEGGLLLTRDAELADRLERCLRRRAGQVELNVFSLSDLNASLAEAQLARLDRLLARRIEIARHYMATLDGVPGLVINSRVRHGAVFFRLPLRLANSEAVDSAIARLAGRGIVARRPVSPLCHRGQPGGGAFPVADVLHACTLSLPLYPSLNDGEVERIAAAAHEALVETAP